MNTRTTIRYGVTGWLTAGMLGLAPLASAGPISGMPVPELANFDTLMDDFMADNGIEAGLLGIMKDGVIVYQRGFGWKDDANTIPLRHDALMRIASCTKPITAAATQNLIASGALNDGDFVFETGQPGGGLLNYSAFPSVADPQLGSITVQHLYTHNGGWDRSITPDLTYREVQIAGDMGIASPPGRINTARWIMGQNLDFTPGSQRQYSNVGFLLLGLIIEQQSGMTHNAYVRQSVFGPMDWMPVAEVVAGRTHVANRDPREPWYDSDKMVQDVFDPDGDSVREPEGGWDHEARVGQGAYVVSTTALLHLAETYYISDQQNGDVTYGTPVNGNRQYRWHNGSMPGGTMSMTVQRADGINYVAIFNKNGTDVNSNQGYHFAIQALMDAEIQGGGFTWPTQGVDGQWVDFNNGGVGVGSFEDAWRDAGNALASAMDEATLNFRDGTSDWTGTINQRVRLRAPAGGTVRIGQQ